MHCILAPLGKPKAEIGTEYPDFVLCGVLPHGLLSPSPLFLRVAAPLRRKLPFSHLQCRFCVGDLHPVPLCFAPMAQSRVPKYAHIRFYRFIMNLFVHFVNRFAEKQQKRKQRRFLSVLKAVFLHKKDPKQCFGSFLVSHRGFEPRAP